MHCFRFFMYLRLMVACEIIVRFMYNLHKFCGISETILNMCLSSYIVSVCANGDLRKLKPYYAMYCTTSDQAVIKLITLQTMTTHSCDSAWCSHNNCIIFPYLLFMHVCGFRLVCMVTSGTRDGCQVATIQCMLSGPCSKIYLKQH